MTDYKCRSCGSIRGERQDGGRPVSCRSCWVFSATAFEEV